MNIYKDIETRTNGEIYIGVVGPVRTGKSTFIKRFMELMVLPAIADDNNRKRAMDELPQSAAGKTVMTTEPKFIPKEAVEVLFEDGVHFKCRMIDCVGYMVQGAEGHEEDGKERLVSRLQRRQRLEQRRSSTTIRPSASLSPVTIQSRSLTEVRTYSRRHRRFRS